MTGRSFWLTLLLGSLLGSLASNRAQAQVSPEAQRRYRVAVQQILTGNLERAKTDLNAIAQREGPLAPYAHYYYALAAYRQKNYAQARLMLKQLMSRYPQWRKMDEAQYLLAAVCMENSQQEDALTAIQQIRDASLQPDINKLEQTFIGRISDLNRLKQLNREFPEDRVVGLTLINLIQRTASDKEDLELSDRLTNRFGAPGVVTTRTTSKPSATTITSNPVPTTAQTSRPARAKGYYNVAVLFPFRLDEFDVDKRGRSNQYVYDLYDGIKMARAKLQEEGITVNLFAYDLDNDANRTLELVNSPLFNQTDLIIGPLYLEPNHIASAYANQNNILLVNPTATSSDLVANQPMSFLAQPSMNQQVKKAVEQALSLNSIRRAAVYYGASRKDSMLAMAYQNELKRQKFQIVDVRKMIGSVQALADAMQLTGTSSPARSVSTVAPVTLGHVFLASSNEDDGTRLIDALSRRKVNAPLIATASAFDFYRNSVATFSRRDLYLVYPDFIDASRERVSTFQEEYLAKRNTIPSVFASEGYDMMLFFGRQLAKNGAPLRNKALFKSDTDDYLLSGFDYTQTNENQIVPIVKFDDGRFIKVKE